MQAPQPPNPHATPANPPSPDPVDCSAEARLGLADGVSRREFIAWSSLDFANSGYTTVVLTAVFNAYFVGSVMAGVPAATLIWTLILAVSYLLVMVTAPFIGAYADLRARKKLFLAWATWGCGMSTALLATVGPGMWWWAAVLLVISNLSYATHQDMTAAFLPEIARPDSLGRVSGYGWAWGYFGGLFALGLSLAWVAIAQPLALGGQAVVAGAMLATSFLFLAVGLPALRAVRDRAVPMLHTERWSARQWRAASWGRIIQTWRDAQRQPDLRRFLACVVVYHAGVQTVITLAAVYAQQAMGFSMAQTIVLILVVNITAALGAWAFGVFQDRLGHTKSLALALVSWMVMVGVAWQADTVAWFWLAANFAGLAMGASQSGARAAIAYLARPGREAETFGLWGVAINLSAILGPLSYGVVTWLTDNSHRTAMLATGFFFVAGLVLLFRVDFARGREHAMRPMERGTVGANASATEIL
jgi:MFS transporter, UMF1 family